MLSKNDFKVDQVVNFVYTSLDDTVTSRLVRVKEINDRSITAIDLATNEFRTFRYDGMSDKVVVGRGEYRLVSSYVTNSNNVSDENLVAALRLLVTEFNQRDCDIKVRTFTGVGKFFVIRRSLKYTMDVILTGDTANVIFSNGIDDSVNCLVESLKNVAGFRANMPHTVLRTELNESTIKFLAEHLKNLYE